MFSKVRRHITYANVAVTIALLFAMAGGAYAAGHYLITSTKQISPKVLKQLKGANGKAGANGAAGAAGAAGFQGTQGPQGPQGPKGDTGEEGEKGEKGTPGTNGKEGSPWTAGGTLPSEKTETGTWEFATANASRVSAPISFPIPLAQMNNPPQELVLSPSHVFYVGFEEFAEKTEPTAMHEACPSEPPPVAELFGGKPLGEPKAAPGFLCAYEENANGVVKEGNKAKAKIITPGLGTFINQEGAGMVGARIKFEQEGTSGSYGGGTWAVTAP